MPGLTFRHTGDAGSKQGDPVIVVVGRNNFREYSKSLDDLVHDLVTAGYDVCRWESRTTQTARWLEQRVNALGGNRFPRWTVPMKLFVLLTRPARWDYFLKFVMDPNRGAARDLRHLISRLPTNRVYLISHSAGGIASAMAESDESISKIVCFGYPFKHPERPDEPSRTAPLRTVNTPFLIIQGDHDDYGTAEDARRYSLSSSIVVARVDSEHGYDRLDAREYRRCLRLVLDFLGEPDR